VTRVVLIFSLFLLLSIDAQAENIAETRKLAEQGDPWYQTEMAMMYHRGKDVPRDYDQAAKWYRLAATQGNAKAQANLGVMYAEGQGMQQDYSIAAEWFLKAAEQGYAPAQHNLGLLYVRGRCHVQRRQCRQCGCEVCGCILPH
jgi:TPR repeat protein